MPAYNAGKWISSAINGILNQTCQNFELLIIDDCSEDNTFQQALDFSKKDNRVKVIRNSENLGKTGSVNRVFRRCVGKFMTIHDADDISKEDRFEKQINAFKQDNRLVVVGTSFSEIDENGVFIRDIIMEASHNVIFDGILEKSQFHGPTAIFKNDLVQNFEELYRPYFKDNYEDSDLLSRILDLGRGTNIKEPLYLYRIHKDSLLRKCVDIRNRNLYKIVSFLIKERRSGNIDSLERGDIEELESYFQAQTFQYQKDHTLIHREAAWYFLYYNLTGRALEESIKALKNEPFKFQNCKLLGKVLLTIVNRKMNRAK